MNEDYHVKVGDFGLSRFNTETQGGTLNKMVGTMAYAAPEVYFGERFSTKSDIFSAAVILWELVTACVKRKYERPYQEFPQLRFDFQIIIQVAKKGARPTIPPCPQGFHDLIKMGWDEHPDQRPTCKDALSKLDALQAEYNQNQAEWDNFREAQTAPAATDTQVKVEQE